MTTVITENRSIYLNKKSNTGVNPPFFLFCHTGFPFRHTNKNRCFVVYYDDPNVRCGCAYEFLLILLFYPLPLGAFGGMIVRYKKPKEVLLWLI